MTEGHRHRTVRVRHGGRLRRFLTKPRWHTTDIRRVDLSPYPYGMCTQHHSLTWPECWYLSILSILHRWTGLTLEVK
jgi:hypothetical protein